MTGAKVAYTEKIAPRGNAWRFFTSATRCISLVFVIRLAAEIVFFVLNRVLDRQFVELLSGSF